MSKAKEILSQIEESSLSDFSQAEDGALKLKSLATKAYEIEQDLTHPKKIGKAVAYLGLEQQSKKVAELAASLEKALQELSKSAQAELKKKS